MRQTVELQESLLDHSGTTYMIYTLEQFAYMPFTCTRQIKIAQPLGLHYIARPLVCSSDLNCTTLVPAPFCTTIGLHYVSLAKSFGLHYDVKRPLWYTH